MKRILQHPALAGVATFLLGLGLAFQALHFWKHDFTDPHCYAGDATIHLAWTKGVLDNAWSLENEYVGAPGKQEMYDFPHLANVHFLALKGLGQIKKDPFWVVNIYYLLSYPLAALGFWLFARTLAVNPWIALVFAVLFAFLPGHFWRGSSHLFLSTYYLVPIGMIPLVWLHQGKLKLSLKDARSWLTVLIAAACGSDGGYFALFTTAVVALGSLIVALRERTRNAWICGGMVVALFAGSFAGNLAPIFAYHYKEGKNPSNDHVSVHDWSEGEIYSLKVMSMVLPTPNHPLKVFREFHNEYYSKTKMPSEAGAMAMGLAGSIGLLIALFGLLKPNLVTERGRFRYLLGIVVVVLILATTISGFGTLANLLHFRTMRSYNRSSFYIALFSLMAFAMLMDSWQRHFVGKPRLRAGVFAAVAALLPCGFLDQAWIQEKPVVAGYQADALKKRQDEAFIQQIESSVPAGSMIFQLPQISAFSQTEGRHKMFHYDHYRAYLHSKTLKWSYGAMHGRHTDNLHTFLGNQPTDKRLLLLSALGFEGLYVDRLGYADAGAKLEAELLPFVGPPSLISENKRFAFYNLADFNKRLREQTAPQTIPMLRATADAAPQVVWNKYAGHEMRDELGTLRFIGGEKVACTATNPSDKPQKFSMVFGVKADAPLVSTLRVKQGSNESFYELFQPATACRMEVELPPGESVIEFRVAISEKFAQSPGGHVFLTDFRFEMPKIELAAAGSR